MCLLADSFPIRNVCDQEATPDFVKIFFKLERLEHFFWLKQWIQTLEACQNKSYWVILPVYESEGFNHGKIDDNNHIHEIPIIHNI